jgi:hypothetical protein
MSTNEMEENEMTTTEVSGELSITEGNVELSTTGGIGEASITEENKEVPVLKTEGNEESRTEGYGEVSITKGIGVLTEVSISEVDFEASTTKGNGETSPSSAVTSVIVLTVSACVAILLGVCLATSIYYWRKLNTTDRSENVQSVNFHWRLNENNESGDAFAEGMNPLSWQPDDLLQEEPSIGVEMELLQYGTSGMRTEETRL